MSDIKVNCPVCESTAYINNYYDPIRTFVQCPICGRFEYYGKAELNKFNLNHLASYLFYNGYKSEDTEYRYLTTMSKDKCEEYREAFNKGNREKGYPIHLSTVDVENWYPKRLTDKTDLIISFINNNTKYIGENKFLGEQGLISCLFLDRYKYDIEGKPDRYYNEKEIQAKYMLNFLEDSNLVVRLDKYTGDILNRSIQLTPEAYTRIERLEKNNKHGKQVLVAMQFGNETKKLRESIRKGISESNYTPIFIDEVQHNDFITPELLKYIRDSKFVVVDLSDKNNGAYFEEGYAMGLGKPVIQLCKSDVTLHFDIAQKNTIIWRDEEDIPLKLKNRIIATIE